MRHCTHPTTALPSRWYDIMTWWHFWGKNRVERQAVLPHGRWIRKEIGRCDLAVAVSLSWMRRIFTLLKQRRGESVHNWSLRLWGPPDMTSQARRGSRLACPTGRKADCQGAVVPIASVENPDDRDWARSGRRVTILRAASGAQS